MEHKNSWSRVFGSRDLLIHILTYVEPKKDNVATKVAWPWRESWRASSTARWRHWQHAHMMVFAMAAAVCAVASLRNTMVASTRTLAGVTSKITVWASGNRASNAIENAWWLKELTSPARMKVETTAGSDGDDGAAVRQLDESATL